MYYIAISNVRAIPTYKVYKPCDYVSYIVVRTYIRRSYQLGVPYRVTYTSPRNNTYVLGLHHETRTAVMARSQLRDQARRAAVQREEGRQACLQSRRDRWHNESEEQREVRLEHNRDLLAAEIPEKRQARTKNE